MFSLIITVVAIALVAVLALATLYYGGSAFGKGAARAEASKIVLQGQQLLGAADLYYTENRKWPTSINELTTDKYLKQIPNAGVSGLADAVAAGTTWTMPIAETPMFVMSAMSSSEVCAEVNLSASLRKKAILRHAYTGLVAQCYGATEPTLKTVFRKAPDTPFTGPNNEGLDPDDVIVGDPPSDSTNPDWYVPPGGTTGGGNGGGGGGTGGVGGIDPPVTGDYECFVETLDTAGRSLDNNGAFSWIWLEGDFDANEFATPSVTIGGIATRTMNGWSEAGYADTMAIPVSALTPGSRNVVMTGATGKTATCVATVVAGGVPVQGSLAWQAAELNHGTFPADYGGVIMRAVSLMNTGAAPVSFSNMRHTAPVGWTVDPSPGWGPQDCGYSGTLAPGQMCNVSILWQPSMSVSGDHNWTLTADSSEGRSAVQRHTLTLLSDITVAPSSVSFPAAVGSVVSKNPPVVTNTSGSPVTLSSFSVAGGGWEFWADMGTCGSTLAPGASCKLHVEFSPSSIQPVTNYAVLTTSAGTFNIALDGKGTCIGGDSNWNATDGYCETPAALNIDLAGGSCLDEYYKPPHHAMYADNYVRMHLPVSGDWIGDMRAARGNYTITKIGGPTNGPFQFWRPTDWDYSNSAWWNGEYHNAAQSMELRASGTLQGIIFESYSDTPNKLGGLVGTSANDAMQFSFSDPQGRYPDATVTAYCDFSPEVVTVQDTTSFYRVYGVARIVGITGGNLYGGTGETGTGGPVDYVVQAGPNNFEVPVTTPWSGSCTSSDAAQFNTCAAQATRIGGGYASCQRWPIEPSATMGAGNYQSRISCTR